MSSPGHFPRIIKSL